MRELGKCGKICGKSQQTHFSNKADVCPRVLSGRSPVQCARAYRVVGIGFYCVSIKYSIRLAEAEENYFTNLDKVPKVA